LNLEDWKKIKQDHSLITKCNLKLQSPQNTRYPNEQNDQNPSLQKYPETKNHSPLQNSLKNYPCTPTSLGKKEKTQNWQIFPSNSHWKKDEEKEGKNEAETSMNRKFLMEKWERGSIVSKSMEFGNGMRLKEKASKREEIKTSGMAVNLMIPQVVSPQKKPEPSEKVPVSFESLVASNTLSNPQGDGPAVGSPKGFVKMSQKTPSRSKNQRSSLIESKSKANQENMANPAIFSRRKPVSLDENSRNPLSELVTQAPLEKDSEAKNLFDLYFQKEVKSEKPLEPQNNENLGPEEAKIEEKENQETKQIVSPKKIGQKSLNSEISESQKLRKIPFYSWIINLNIGDQSSIDSKKHIDYLAQLFKELAFMKDSPKCDPVQLTLKRIFLEKAPRHKSSSFS
jgi:hypothetical protein